MAAIFVEQTLRNTRLKSRPASTPTPKVQNPMVDPTLSFDLPPFLTPNPGLNSGLMIAEVTTAALMSENKHLAHPTVIDSTPTSANQEDHVSMAAHGARRLTRMNEVFRILPDSPGLANDHAG